jgi:hypothetical protein
MKNPVVLAVFLFTLIGVLILTKQIQTPKIFLPKASVIGVSLSLIPTKISLDPGNETAVDLLLNPDGESVSAIELVLNYDPSIIQITDIKPTTALPQALALDLSKPGRASVILLVNPASTNPPEGIVGKVTVKAIKSGSTSIKFDPTTKVSASGKTGDVTGAVEAAEITVNGSLETPATDQKSVQIPENSQADDLIKQFIDAKDELQESSPSGGIVRDISIYIKKTVEEINLAVEKQARRFLD